MPKRFILVARYPSIEPLGIHYLLEVPREAGWEASVVLVKNDDFEPLWEAMRVYRPHMVGFHIWAGYHLPMLAAAHCVRSSDVPVIMGGPYATYAHEQCFSYADWIVRGSGFGLLRRALEGTLPPGTHFDPSARAEIFPVPSRDILYGSYPEFGKSPIKSIFASIGCPYTCSYCHAPEFNKMHGGFAFIPRSISDVIAEAAIVMRGWPETRLFYFQDDVFGFDEKVWLPEFARRWKQEIGAPFHCQLRLEMTRHASGNRRLDFLAEAGCTGITLAIESDSEFLRDHVLFRPMPDHLIVEGCRKIMDRGMTLRTEQILAVPFSDVTTDLGTLGLNVRINPTMAWTSILSPYPGVPLGAMARDFGLWAGTDDDLRESFLARSVLSHVANGPRDIATIVNNLGRDRARNKPLLHMHAKKNDGFTADVFYGTGTSERVGSITYLSHAENEHYRNQTVRLQRLFNWLSHVPDGAVLGRALADLSEAEWSWGRIGSEAREHLVRRRGASAIEEWGRALACEMGLSSTVELPKKIAENPWYFCYFPAGAELAKRATELGLLNEAPAELIEHLSREARHHLFEYGLYRVKDGPPPIGH